MSLGNFSKESGQTIENIDNAWRTTKQVLKDELDSQIFSAYIEPLRFFPGPGEIKVLAPSRFVCAHVENNYGERIRDLIANKIPIVNDEAIPPLKFVVSATNDLSKASMASLYLCSRYAAIPSS